MPPVELPDGTLLQLCDAEGRLTFADVSKHPNGEDLNLLNGHGMLTEVLDHNIEREEPTACSLISRAMNQKNEIVLGNYE